MLQNIVAPRCLFLESCMPTATKLARLTPRGRGAIASVGLCGDQAMAMVENCFETAAGYPFSQAKRAQIVFGYWTSNAHTREELVVSRVDEQRVEIHCHGGDAAVTAIVQSLLRQGAEEVTSQEYSLLSGYNLLQAEAMLALAQASTLRTAEILLAQYHGALQREVASIQNLLHAHDIEPARRTLAALLAWANVGTHCTQPWRVVLAGHPNVGKSSLMNALVGYERSIVFETPGTTRDLVTASTACQGWPVTLTDAAGLRTTHEPLERAGVQLAWEKIGQADLVLLVADASQPWPAEYDRWLTEWKHVLVVMNKCDLARAFSSCPVETAIWVSAREGTGLDVLVNAIAHYLVPQLPERNQGIPFLERHTSGLALAQKSLNTGDIPAALAALQEIFGNSEIGVTLDNSGDLH
jgi:tRNA modification GTPase